MQVTFKNETHEFFDAGARLHRRASSDICAQKLFTESLDESSARVANASSKLIYENTSTSVLRLCNALRQLNSDIIEPGQGKAKDNTQLSLDEWVNYSLSGISWDPKHVVLTGSTGSLTSYLLHTLLNNSTVDVVYCLSRRRDAKEVQLSSHVARGLSVDFHKVVFLHADLTKPDL
jgi:hypothetical protein